MASYSVNRGKHSTLVAATVDTVTFAYAGVTVRVRNRSASGDIYFTVDSSVPTSAGDDTYFCGPGESVQVQTRGKVIKLISAGTPDYSVELY